MRYARSVFFGWLLAAAALLAPIGLATASSMEGAVMSDAALASALASIRAMPREELTSFISYLAACRAAELYEGGASSFECERARNEYVYRYSNGRPLDRYLSAVDFTNRLLTNNDKLPPGKKRNLDNLILRVMEIHSGLRDACGARYRELKPAL